MPMRNQFRAWGLHDGRCIVSAIADGLIRPVEQFLFQEGAPAG